MKKCSDTQTVYVTTFLIKMSLFTTGSFLILAFLPPVLHTALKFFMPCMNEILPFDVVFYLLIFLTIPLLFMLTFNENDDEELTK